MLKYALRENLLTPEPDDYMAQTVDARSYSGEEIVELMLKRGSTLTKADAAAAVELYNTVCAELIADGCNLNTPLMNTNLSEVTIPASVTEIGPYAFQDCTGLSEVTIPASVKTIGPGAFYSCIGLTEVTIPEGVTTIGDYAFANTDLSEVTFEETDGWHTKSHLYDEAESPESIDVGDPSANAEKLREGEWYNKYLIRVEP